MIIRRSSSAQRQLITKVWHAFEHFNPHRIERLAESVDRKLRTNGLGQYPFEVSARPFPPQHGAFYTHLRVVSDGTEIHIRVRLPQGIPHA